MSIEAPATPEELAAFEKARNLAKQMSDILDDALNARQQAHALSLMVAWHLIQLPADMRLPASKAIARLTRYQLRRGEKNMQKSMN